MNIPTLDHLISFYKEDDIVSHLDLYKKAGFAVTDEKVRHPYGLKNRFINFGLEYIEFFCVENKKEFQDKSSRKSKYFFKHGVGGAFYNF